MPFTRRDESGLTTIESAAGSGLHCRTEFIPDSLRDFVQFIKQESGPTDTADPWQILAELLPEYRATINLHAEAYCKQVLATGSTTIPPFEDDDDDTDS